MTTFGRFDDVAREYVITRPDTPLPWINYLGSEDFFGLVSNTAGGYSFSARVSTAFGVDAANQPNYKCHVEMCKARSEVDPAWADACLRYGQVAEQRRKTVLGQTSARTLQIAVLEAIGDEEAIARVRARVQQGVTTADRRRADALIVSGPRPFGRYLAKLRESGELAAVAYMLEEATSLSAALPAECLQSRRAE